MKKLLTGIVFAFFASVVLTLNLTRADSTSREVGHQVSVQGTARFEERHTIVPVGFCEADHQCFSSKVYWSLLIESDSEKFEVDQRFNEGQSTPPEIVELDGFPVRVGSVLRLKAVIEDGSNDYYYIGNIHDVDGTDDVQNLAQSSLPNWTCRGNYNSGIQIQVDVWLIAQTDVDAPNRYGMRVIGVEETPAGDKHTYSVASLVDGSATITDAGLTYVGQSRTSVNADQVRLTVSEWQAAKSIPGELRVSVGKTLFVGNIPSDLDLPVSCNRSR